MNIMIFINLSYVHNRHFPSHTIRATHAHHPQGLLVRHDKCLYIGYVHIVDSSLPLNQWFICRVAMLRLVTENILQKWLAFIGCVQFVPYIYIFEYVYVVHCCWFFRNYVFNDVGYVINKGGEVRNWLFEAIYIYMLYIYDIADYLFLIEQFYIYILVMYIFLPLNQWFICRVSKLWLVVENILQKWPPIVWCVQ
jgi:hypothetical protein